jgi:hypothetical protein
MPRGTPRQTPIMSATRASSTVAGKTMRRSSTTFWPVVVETPRSPCRTLPT